MQSKKELAQVMSQLDRQKSQKNQEVVVPVGVSNNVDLEADPLDDQQINQLQLKITRIKDENKGLREKIEAANSGISSYISEMSTMLDSNDLSMLGSGAPTLQVADGQ